MNVMFLGNHTVGIATLQALTASARVVGVVAHPPDPEDGTRYLSVYEHARSVGIPAIRARGGDDLLAKFVSSCRPDLLFVADYRYILPQRVLELAPLGGVNLHPSLLPKYRGRASINWAILHGETELGLTAHMLDQGMDTGDIIIQESYRLDADQDIDDALRILYPLYGSITRSVMAMFREGAVSLKPQDHALATSFPRRRPSDGMVDFSRPASEVLNLVRAVAKPYPGAFSFCRGTKVTFWKAALSEATGAGHLPGSILNIRDGVMTVVCGEGCLCVTQWEADGEWTSAVGERFQSQEDS